MKKNILLITFIIICFVFQVKAQTLQTRTDGTYTEKDERLAVGMNLIIPRGSVNTLNGGLTDAGQLFFNTTDNKLYVWNGSIWNKVSEASELSLYYTKAQVDSLQTVISSIVAGKENLTNKAVDFSVKNNSLYPTVKAVSRELDLKANDVDVVHKTGNEIINGDKTFESIYGRGVYITEDINSDQIYTIHDANIGEVLNVGQDANIGQNVYINGTPIEPNHAAKKGYVDDIANNKTNINGSNATGTWSINTTGNAATATNVTWSGVTEKPLFSTIATTGSYSDLNDKPIIPTNNNQLTNGAGYITNTSISGKADNVSVIHKTGDEEKSGMLTFKDSPDFFTELSASGIYGQDGSSYWGIGNDYIQLNNKASIRVDSPIGGVYQDFQLPGYGGYLAIRSDFGTGKTIGANTTGNAATATNVTWSGVTEKPLFSTIATTGSYSDLNDKPIIPTNNNQLTNGSGFITSSDILNYGYATNANLIEKANKDGSDAIGTWGISISGNATSANSWGGRTANFDSNVSDLNVLVGRGTDEVVRNVNVSQLKSFMGIPSGGETLQSIAERGNTFLDPSNPNNKFIGVGKAMTDGEAAFLGWRYNGGDSYGYVETYSGTKPLVLQRGNPGKVFIGNTSDVGNGTKLQVAGSTYISGTVLIGTINDNNIDKLQVKGTIKANAIKVDPNAFPDFVFLPTYKLRSLETTEQYIKKFGHLPEIPSATEVEKDGLELGDMTKKLLQKIEELTLYMIELKKDNMQLRKEVNQLNNKK